MMMTTSADMLCRGDLVPPPSAGTEYTARFGDSDAAKGWEDLCRVGGHAFLLEGQRDLPVAVWGRRCLWSQKAASFPRLCTRAAHDHLSLHTCGP